MVVNLRLLAGLILPLAIAFQETHQVLGGHSDEVKVYYVTSGDGVKVLYPRTSQVSQLVSSNETLFGIAYDIMSNKLYWSSSNKIYRCDAIDGGNVEIVYSAGQCKHFI